MDESSRQVDLPEDTHLGYIVSHEAWYARVPGVVDRPSITIAASASGIWWGVAWEFVVEEVDLGRKAAIQARIFDDAFAALTQIPEFFRALATRKVTSLAEVRALLDEMLAVDETDRVGPEKVAGAR